jgi:hypothetical protein
LVLVGDQCFRQLLSRIITILKMHGEYSVVDIYAAGFVFISS